MKVYSEKSAITKMERYYLRHKRPVIYTALENIEDTEWFWSRKEIRKFDRLWNQDMPIRDIAKELRRTEMAVFLLSLDRLFKEKIKPRNWKIW
jgi:hypothetical protein